MHTYAGPEGTTFHYNSDFSGDVYVRAEEIEISIPAGDLMAFVVGCGLRVYDLDEWLSGFRELIEPLSTVLEPRKGMKSPSAEDADGSAIERLISAGRWCAWCDEAINPGRASVPDECGDPGERLHIGCSIEANDDERVWGYDPD